ncbi:O-antigen ligase domain-containing protein [Vibrio fluvialis]|nr:O-antigen ligase domain-containing protein [Vibrio fluvialis]MBY8265419.1 O-antigen ligase domain-containing protein [Vibrio fluvialis]
MVNRNSLWETLIVKLTFWSLIVFSFNVFIPRNQLLFIYDSKRLVVSLLLILFAAGLVMSARIRQPVIKVYQSLEQPVKGLVVVFVVFSMIATALSHYSVSAPSQWFYLVGLFLLLGLFNSYFQSSRSVLFNLAMLLNVLLFLSVAVAFWTLLYHRVPVGTTTFYGFSNPRFINQVQVWLILPMAYLAVRALRRKKSAFLPLLSVSIAFSVCFTLNGRGVVLAVLSGFILMSLVDRALWRQWIKTLLIAAFFGACISFAFLNPLPSYLLDIETEAFLFRTTSSGRIALWQDAWSMTTFWGNGGGAFVCQNFALGRPHNSVLNVLVHWGWISAACYVALCFLLLFKVATAAFRVTKVLGASVLTGLLYSLVSGVLDSPMSQLLAIISLAAFWASLKPKLSAVAPSLLSHVIAVMLALGVITTCSYRLYDRWVHYPQQPGEIVDVKSIGMKTQFWVGFNCLENPDMP